MKTFTGKSDLTLDNKGRITLPTRYRSHISESLVITIDISDSCLLLYPMEHWCVIEHDIMLLPNMTPSTRRMQRLILGYASEICCHNSGKILIPAPLREYAQLTRDAVLIGQGNKFELWSQTNWQQQLKSLLSTTDDELCEQVRHISL